MKSSSRSSKRKRKHSQKRSKKKSRSSREKIKKSKRRDYSVSSCSDDEDSMSCSSRGDDDKKRGRSRDRKSKKDKKRSKSKRISWVNESSGDDLPRVKKSKRLRKGRSLDDKKKRRGKKRRRVGSVSSMSSSSRSGSGSERSDDSEEELERKVEEVEINERKGREKKRSGSVSWRSSKSSSPCSLHSEEVSSPKRLKSVIVVMKDRDVVEEHESIRDDRYEDEIDCEFDDDYPSKSNDSIDGVSGREAIPNIHDVSSKERLLNEPNKELFASDVKSSEGLGIQRESVEGSKGVAQQCTINDPPIGNISEICTENAGSRRADLEANLRQKALENLLKRKGKFSAKIPGDKEGGYDIKVKKPSIVIAQHIDHHMLHEGSINSVRNVGKGDDEHKPHDDENITYVQKVDDKHMPRYDENIKSEQKVGRGVDFRYTTSLHSHSVKETGPSKYSDAHRLNMNDQTARLAGMSKVSSNSFSGRPNVSLSMSRNEFLGRKNTWKRQLTPNKDCEENLSAPRENIAKDPTQKVILQEGTEPTLSTPQETIRDSSSQQFDTKLSAEKVVADGSSDPSHFGGQRMNDKTSETDEENQFQQKTMSVMRGGEMVQVSYKVYIPKTTPALTRRKLKR